MTSSLVLPAATQRRQFLGLAGAAIGAAALAPAAAFASPAKKPEPSGLDAKLFERILRAPAKDGDGVVSVSIGRNDIEHATAPAGAMPGGIRVPFNPAFELGGEMVFQPLDARRAMLNGDFVFLAEEINPAIDAMLAHGLELQALHQHYFDVRPMVWFMHFRGIGTPEALARAGAAVVAATATKLPQTEPGKLTSPLPKDAIGKILGADPLATLIGIMRNRVGLIIGRILLMLGRHAHILRRRYFGRRRLFVRGLVPIDNHRSSHSGCAAHSAVPP